jgi:hypothetical protein
MDGRAHNQGMVGADFGLHRGDSSEDCKKLKTAAVFLTKRVVYFYHREFQRNYLLTTAHQRGVAETGSAFSDARKA